MAKKKGTRKTGRSAITGKFVTKGYVKKHPKTTVTEKSKSLVAARRNKHK